MRLTVLTVLAAVLLAGCGIYPGHRSAAVECVCPRGQPQSFQISLTTPTGPWRFSVHAGGLYEEIRLYAIHLPGPPPPTVHYVSSEISAFDVSGESRVSVPISGGFVTLDKKLGQVVVALETATGPFLGNGKYPLDAF